VLACLFVAGTFMAGHGLASPALAQSPSSREIQPRIIVQNGHAAETSAAAWTADGLFLLTGSTDGQILLWDLPGGAGTEDSVFSAYAFNEDRVKSDTARIEYRRAPAPPQAPRAFVVSIGVDAYDVPRLNLQFAASDAELIGNRLAAIPGYDARRIKLAGARSATGALTHVSRKAVEAVLGALAGGDVAAATTYLQANGVDASDLDHARPDDIVIGEIENWQAVFAGKQISVPV
jgi:hypothetical protein